MRIKDLIEADVTDLNWEREKRAREREKQKYAAAGDRVKQREAEFQQARDQMKTEISKVIEEPFRLMGFPQITLLDIMKDLRFQNVPTDYAHMKSWYNGFGEDNKRKLVGMFGNARNIDQIIQRIDKAYDIYLEFSKKWNNPPYSEILRDDVAYLKINRGKVNILSIFFNRKSVEQIKESRLDIIAESLDNPYAWRKSRPKSYETVARYVFQTKPTHKKFSINFYYVDPSGIVLEFDRLTPTGSTVNRTYDTSPIESLRIFATVKDVLLKDFLSTFPQTNIIHFKGEIEKGETIEDSNRISLYRKIANMLKTELHWDSVSERSTSNAVMWTIRKGDTQSDDEVSPTHNIPSSKKKKNEQ